MASENGFRRSLAIFRLALSFWGDARAIARAKRRLPADDAKREESRIYRVGGLRFTREALRLGGLIIKVGQFLSARTDVLPLEFTRQLQTLQDQVPPASFREIQKTLAAAYGKHWSRVFLEFSPEPVAAASLGQVHRAILAKTEEVVAVKVRRPGIDELAAIDLKALGRIMGVLRRWTKPGRRIDTVQLFEEFRDMVHRELDYRQELTSLQAFGQNFADNPSVRVPKAYPEFSRETVLVMEFVSGFKLTDRKLLVEAGLQPKALARILVNAFLQQIIQDGLVQIDPHPGNFFAAEDGRIVFLDFGMMGHIPAEHLSYAARFLEGILTKDARRVVEAIDGLGFLAPHAQKTLLQRAVSVMLERSAGTPLSPSSRLDGVVRDFQDFLYEEPLLFPAQYMFLGRAIGMLFGLVSGLDPDLDWVELLRQEALPLLNQKRRENGAAWLSKIREGISDWLGPEAGTAFDAVGQRVWDAVGTMQRVPVSLDRVLLEAESGSLVTRPELSPVTRRLDRLGDLIEALMGLVAASGSGALAMVFIAHHWLVPGDIAWIVTGMLLVLTLRARQKAKRRVTRRVWRPDGDRR